MSSAMPSDCYIRMGKDQTALPFDLRSTLERAATSHQDYKGCLASKTLYTSAGYLVQLENENSPSFYVEQRAFCGEETCNHVYEYNQITKYRIAPSATEPGRYTCVGGGELVNGKPRSNFVDLVKSTSGNTAHNQPFMRVWKGSIGGHSVSAAECPSIVVHSPGPTYVSPAALHTTD